EHAQEHRPVDRAMTRAEQEIDAPARARERGRIAEHHEARGPELAGLLLLARAGREYRHLAAACPRELHGEVAETAHADHADPRRRGRIGTERRIHRETRAEQRRRAG